MRPVSDRFLAAVRGSHRMVARARIVEPGQHGADPDGIDIPILSGSTVLLDASADVRSTLDLVTDGAWWPSSASDPLTPYGNELHIRRGIVTSGSTIEWVSLGYYRIDTVEQDRGPDGPIRVTGRDRMASIVDARLTEPLQIPATTQVGDAVERLVLEVLPDAVIEWDDSTDTRPLGRSILVEEDRYAALRDIVTSYGKIAYWDHRGVLVIQTPPDPTQPVYVVDHGARGVLTRISRRLSRQNVYNAVVAIGEGADTATPVRAVAVDSHPLSPTRWDGPFGRVPRFYSSPLITSLDQAHAAARSILIRESGLPYSIEVGLVPNPALEPYDPIRVRYPGRSERHIIDRLTIPLTADGVMTGATRQLAYGGG